MIGRVRVPALKERLFFFGGDDTPPWITDLSKGMAGWRVGLDRDGNVYLLGFDRDSFDRIVAECDGGEYPLVHRFSPEGALLGSSLPITVDASSEELLSAAVWSLLNQPGNFVVTPGGDVWVAWITLPVGGVGETPPARLFHMKPNGVAVSVELEPLEAGALFSGLVEHSATGEVLIEWKSHREGTGFETTLETAGGAIFGRGHYPGQVMGLDDDSVVTAAFAGGVHSLFLTPVLQ
jgi:hypothetical protein